MNEALRLADLMRQGFMKPRKVRKPRAKPEIVTCYGCMNWHPKSKHTVDAATRKKNLAEHKASEARYARKENDHG